MVVDAIVNWHPQFPGQRLESSRFVPQFSGQGSVYFYDVRAEKYLELFCGASVQLEAGVGWLNHDDTYHDFFVGHEYPNAIYTHCYDPAGTRLFTAGALLSTVDVCTLL